MQTQRHKRPIIVLCGVLQLWQDKRHITDCRCMFCRQVANLTCSMSTNEEGIKMVRLAAAQLEILCPQVINAARVLTARPRSKVALENMDVFKEAWQRQVHLLMDAVDDITTIDDFLAVSGEPLSSFSQFLVL